MPIRLGSSRALVFIALTLAALAFPAKSICQIAPSPDQQAPAADHSTRMDLVYGRPFVSVMVNGKGPFRFFIDTGTGGDAIVTPALATQLGLPVVGQATLSDPSGEGGRHTPIVQLDTLELAGVTFNNVRALSNPFFVDSSHCDGILGFTLFRNFLLTLDFPNRVVTLSAGALVPDGDKTVLPFRMPHGVPIATLRLDGLEPLEAQLDSGGGGLVIPAQIAARLKYDVNPVAFAKGHSVSTRFELKAGKLASDVRLGHYTFTHPVVEIHPAFPLINFGSPPMQIFAITFDQRNLLVRFASSHRRFSLSAPPNPSRLNFEPAPNPPAGDLVPVG